VSETSEARSRAVRLPPLPGDQWDDRTREALTGLLPRASHDPAAAGNAVATLLRHPDLTKAFLTFNMHLLFGSTLPPRLRELAILRVARSRGCQYEWVHHTRMAAQAGLSEAEIEAAGRGDGLAPLDAAVLTAVEELDRDSRLSDRTWSVLGEHLDERQRMDLIFTVGAYCLLAMAFNTFGVQPENER
jgi:4-carboxymuconolactone decarboxylase